MQREVDDFTPFQSPLLKTFFESFTSYVKCKDEEKQVTTDLKKAMKESDAFRKELNDSFITGHGCYQQSKWIGLDRYVIFTLFYALLLVYSKICYI